MTKEEISVWFINFLEQCAKKNKKIRNIATFHEGVEFTYNETEYAIHIFGEDEIVYGPTGHSEFSVGESIWEQYEVRVEENYQDAFEDYFDNVIVEDPFKFANKLWSTLNKFREEVETNGVESFFYDIIDGFIEAHN